MDVSQTGFEIGRRVRQAMRPTKWDEWLPDSFSFAPWWRWGCASRLVTDSLPATEWPDDVHIRRLVRFMSATDPSRDKSLGTAFEIFTGPPLRRAFVDACLLTGQSFPAVARKSGLPPAVTRIYAAAFCDVAGRLKIRGWLARWFLSDRSAGLPVLVGREWKRAALAGGMALMDPVVAASFRFGLVGACPLGPSPPEVPVRVLAAARRNLLAACIPDDRIHALHALVRVVGPRGVTFTVRGKTVTVAIKDSLIGRASVRMASRLKGRSDRDAVSAPRTSEASLLNKPSGAIGSRRVRA